MNGASPDTSSTSDSASQYRHALVQVQHEYQAFLPLTQQVQADLRSDAADLRAQEGWDLATQRGIDAWVDDSGSIFRFLKRNDFDEKKAYAKLLDALVERVERALHQPIPAIPPYSASELFHILPLPHHTDILGRPIAVLRPRDIKRNENGELEDLIEWTWWCCETLRRTLQEFWDARLWGLDRKGSGGEGCVVIVDAAGAGYRNLEVELLPALTKVGSRNFPGMVQAVFIVNAGWTQRSLWTIVRKVVPKAAVERIKFVDTPGELGQYFDMAKLPPALGGTSDYSFTSGNPILGYYSTHPVGTFSPVPLSARPPVISAPIEERSLTRATSFASTAELFYSAQNSPTTSRTSSHNDLSFLRSHKQLRVTKIAPSPLATAHPSPGTPEAQPLLEEDAASTPLAIATITHLPSRAASTHAMPARWTSDSADSNGPLSRVKSLTDFKLYLSPSRLAQVDLLDEHDDEIGMSKLTPLMQRRRTLRPALLDCPSYRGAGFAGERTLAQRRSRPALHIVGPAAQLVAGDMARSYSDRLMQHHAVVLHKLDDLSPDALHRITSGHKDGPATPPEPSDAAPAVEPPSIATMPTPRPPADHAARIRAQDDHAAHLERISAFSRSLNPYYGYPALRSPTAPHKILPAHPRRKRDLVKTLLFLFILRLQSLRDAFERLFGLNRLLPWADLHSKWVKAHNPEEGLLRDADPKKGSVVKRTRESDWVWMGIGLLLLRGGWERLISWPLEILGWEGARARLGLS